MDCCTRSNCIDGRHETLTSVKLGSGFRATAGLYSRDSENIKEFTFYGSKEAPGCFLTSGVT